MIQPQSYLHVADNSGAKRLMYIRVLGKNQKQVGKIGDTVIAVVKEAFAEYGNWKRSDVVRVLCQNMRKGINQLEKMGWRSGLDDNV